MATIFRAKTKDDFLAKLPTKAIDTATLNRLIDETGPICEIALETIRTGSRESKVARDHVRVVCFCEEVDLGLRPDGALCKKVAGIYEMRIHEGWFSELLFGASLYIDVSENVEVIRSKATNESM